MTTEGEAKIHAAGKKVSSDVMLGLDATESVQDSIAAFLKENGR